MVPVFAVIPEAAGLELLLSDPPERPREPAPGPAPQDGRQRRRLRGAKDDKRHRFISSVTAVDGTTTMTLLSAVYEVNDSNLLHAEKFLKR